jgi:hypothetical protein
MGVVEELVEEPVKAGLDLLRLRLGQESSPPTHPRNRAWFVLVEFEEPCDVGPDTVVLLARIEQADI